MKKFLVICNKNVLSYNEIFPLFKDNKIYLGYNKKNQTYKLPNGEYKTFGNIGWITTFDVEPNKELVLTKRYNPSEYPTYDNFNAIEVSKTKDIPYDYDGIMGVPITFLDKYNPNQFEILGTESVLKISKGRTYIDGKRMYGRLFIRKK